MTLSGPLERLQFLLSRPGIVRAALLQLAVACLPAVSPAGDLWIRDYDEAMAAAERTGRPVLTVFTGSDWCPHCVTMEKKVLESPEFLAWSENRVVLLMIDLPQQGISAEERHARSRVCIRYGVRSFPNTVLIAPDGAKIACQPGYQGQSPEAWLAALDQHVPPPAAGGAPGDGRILSSLDEAVETARGSRRPMLVLVSRPGDSSARSRVATLVQDPEFESLARENFVLAHVAPRDEGAPRPSGAPETLLGGEPLAPEAVELVVTEDGTHPIHAESGSQPATRIVTGLRRFLAHRHAVRQPETRR